jgi:hypothetical protein
MSGRCLAKSSADPPRQAFDACELPLKLCAEQPCTQELAKERAGHAIVLVRKQLDIPAGESLGVLT